MTMPILHLLGAGRTARTLARLWVEAGVLSIGQVCNRSRASSQDAVAWIGQGTAVDRLDGVGNDDWLLLGVPDSVIEASASDLPRVALAFHLSGAESSARIGGVGDHVAAVHPVCAFADPERARRAFPGSFCVGEGDPEALDRLLPAFEAIGGRALRFSPVDKRLYHAAMISASNFLCTLDALALDLAEAGGLEREQAAALVTTLQHGALGTIAEQGPERALTGPIERNDAATCAALARTVRDRAAHDEEFRARVDPLFRSLSLATVELARRKHPGQDAHWDALRRLYLDSHGEGGG